MEKDVKFIRFYTLSSLGVYLPIDKNNPGKLVSVFEYAGGESIWKKNYLSTTQMSIRMAYEVRIQEESLWITFDYYSKGYMYVLL